MALEDLFDGMKAGRDAYFNTEDKANQLSSQRLALMGLEQAYADDQYLKPAELAAKLSGYQNNTASNKFNTFKNQLNLGALEQSKDNYTQKLINDYYANNLKSQLGVGESQLNLDVFNATRPTLYDTALAKAYNNNRNERSVVPSIQNAKVARAALSSQTDNINYRIGELTRNDKILAGVNDAAGNLASSQMAASGKMAALDWAKKHPEKYQHYLENIFVTPTIFADTIKYNAMTDNEKARVNGVYNELEMQVALAERNGEDVDTIYQNYANGMPDERTALALHIQAEKEKQLELAKAQAKSKSVETPEQQRLKTQILLAPESVAGQLGVPVQVQTDAKGNKIYSVPSGTKDAQGKPIMKNISESDLEVLLIINSGIDPSSYYKLKYDQNRVNNPQQGMFGYGGQ